MTDQVTSAALAGGEPSSAAAPAIIERTVAAADIGDKTGPNAIAAAARALSAQRWAKPKDNNQSAESAPVAVAPAQESTSQEGDTAAAEPHGETTTEAGDAALEVPHVERPQSWAQELDDAWGALTPEMQQRIASSERDRNSSTNKRLQEVAEQRKAVETERAQIKTNVEQYAAKIAAVDQMLQTEGADKFPEIKSFDDYQRIANHAHAISTTDPFTAGQLGNYLKAYDVHMQKVQQVKAERTRADELLANEHMSDLRKYEADELVKVAEAVPEWKEPDKLNARIREGVDYLKANFGYTTQDIQRYATSGEKPFVLSAGFMQVVDKAMRWDAAQAAKTSVVQNKTVPAVQRPGTSRPTGAANSERIQTLNTQFDKKPDAKNAAALLIAQRNAQRRAS